MAAVLSAICLAGTAVSAAQPLPQTASQSQAQAQSQSPSQAQSQTGDGQGESLHALRNGRLTVWFVGEPTHPPQTNLQAIAALHNATPLTYQEKTPSTLGQSSGTFGHDAGSYGVDASSPTIGTPQPAPGQDAPSAKPNGIGYREQESGSFGQQAGSYGTTAGSYGTTGDGSGQRGSAFGQDAGSFGGNSTDPSHDVGSFGYSTSTIANAANSTPAAQADPAAEGFAQRLQQTFPDLQLKFTEVAADELKDRLIATQGSASYPDVLVGALPQTWWTSMQSQFGLAMLRPASFYPNGVTEDPPLAASFAILARASHMQEARAFALWMSEPYSGCPGCVQAGLSRSEQAAANAAEDAMGLLLNGQSLGDGADPEMARSSSLGVRRMLSTIGSTSAADATPHVEVEHASTDGSLAAVGLRVVVSSPGVFGVAHPLVVLRLSPGGHWRVLQVSLNLPQVEQASLRRAMMITSPTSAAEQRAGVKGVSLASPQDGDTKPPSPDLVWDNNGGAGLQVVEWQHGHQGGWSDARIYLVQDRGPRLQTQVRAEFAVEPGRYRWRVWSVGDRGEMKISAWRTFNVTQ